MREAVFAFAKIQLRLHYQHVAPVEHMLVTTVALGSFSAALITSFFFNDNTFIRLRCRALLCMYKPGKSNMFSVEVKTKHRKEMTA